MVINNLFVNDLINFMDALKIDNAILCGLSITYTSLNEEISSWLNGICLSASSYTPAQCLIALRDTDLRN